MIIRYVLLVFLLLSASYAQDVTSLIAAGREFLSKQDITNANGKFRAAVAAASDNEAANALYAFTRILVLPSDPAANSMLDRLGMSKTNRSIFHWDTTVPLDTNGVPFAPATFNVAEGVDLWRTNILREIGAAAQNLGKVSGSGFLLNLTSNETSFGAVTLDLGDVRLLQALLHFTEYFGYTITSWNFDVQLAAVRRLYTTGVFSAERVLSDFPELLTFATTNDLHHSQLALQRAASVYANASDLIRTRPTNLVRLFNYDPEMDEAEKQFRATLTEVRQSLEGPVVLSENTNVVVELGNQFAAPIAVRELLPAFNTNAIIAGSFPDVSFGNVTPGMTRGALEGLLGNTASNAGTSRRGVRFVSRFSLPARLPGGRFRISLEALEGSFFEIQYSTDVENWISLTSGKVRNGGLEFSDTEAFMGPRRFYRAVDRSDAVRFEGKVLAVLTDQPVSGAAVTLAYPELNLVGAATVTSVTGEFSLFSVPRRPQGMIEVTISAPGFSIFTFNDFYSRTKKPFEVEVYLASPEYVPANDNFSNRQLLSGTAVEAVGYNVQAENLVSHILARGNRCGGHGRAPRMVRCALKPPEARSPR